jgi:hypothetical protein
MPEGAVGLALAGPALDSDGAERQLWCAVIGRALEDALGNVGGVSGESARWRAVDEARAWFFENGDDFRSVCDAAGYDPDVLRARAMRLIAGGIDRPAPRLTVISRQERDDA